MHKSTPNKFRWMKWQEAGWRTVAAELPPASARSFTLHCILARIGREWCVLMVPGLGQITW